MSISTEVRTERRPAVRPVVKARRSPGTFYRVVWRWHFYAGMLIAPVLLVVAATGALYIFKDEIEAVLYADLLFAVPADSQVSYDRQVEIAQAAAGEDFKVTRLVVPAEPEEATSVEGVSGNEFRRLFVDPYGGKYQGELHQSGFFPVVLKIHRTLFVGTAGRIVVELMTCWTIVLLITGVYLWWPRKRKQTWGVWLPRVRGGLYRALRDMHAVAGIYVAAIALTIAGTGLIYTYFWGQGYGYVARKTGAYAVYYDPPKSKSPADAAPLPLDDLVRIARAGMPDAALTCILPRSPDGAHVVFATRPLGPNSDEMMVIDHATGEVLAHKYNSEFPALGWWSTWNYPLHVGSVLGLPTKILWLFACLALMALPITGVWMWWQRRPKGTVGLPRKSEARVPQWLVAVICALGVVLPVMGVSLLLILLGEESVRWLRRPRVAN